MLSESTILFGKFTLLACSIIAFCAFGTIVLMFSDKISEDQEDQKETATDGRSQQQICQDDQPVGAVGAENVSIGLCDRTGT